MKDNKKNYISFDIDDELWEALNSYCKEANISSRSEAIRNMMRDSLRYKIDYLRRKHYYEDMIELNEETKRG